MKFRQARLDDGVAECSLLPVEYIITIYLACFPCVIAEYRRGLIILDRKVARTNRVFKTENASKPDVAKINAPYLARSAVPLNAWLWVKQNKKISLCSDWCNYKFCATVKFEEVRVARTGTQRFPFVEFPLLRLPNRR